MISGVFASAAADEMARPAALVPAAAAC